MKSKEQSEKKTPKRVSAVVRSFWLKLKYLYWWHIGIAFFNRVFGQCGPSKNQFVVISRHPGKSITWTWALYWSKPDDKNRSPFKFWFSKQKIMLKNKAKN